MGPPGEERFASFPGGPREPPMGGGSVDLVARQGRNLVGTWQNLVLAVYGDSPDAIPMRAIHASHLDLLQRFDKVGHLVLIHGMPRLPTPEARELATEFNRQSRMSSIAVVLDGEGFWASAARGFLTAVFFFQRNTVPTQLFGTLDEALRWQAFVLGPACPDRDASREAILALQDLSMDTPEPEASEWTPDDRPERRSRR